MKFKRVKQLRLSNKLDENYIRNNSQELANNLASDFENKGLQESRMDHWKHSKTIISNSTFNLRDNKEEKQQWMKDEILNLMDEKRKLKNQNIER